jgi:outer membrane protein
MKNLSLILNIVLLVAVAVLFWLHFSPKTKASVSGNDAAAVDLSNFKVAYINSDTVLKYYDYFKAERDQLVDKQNKMNTEYRNRAIGLQNEIAAYQRSVNTMTLGQVRATEEELGKKQQNLQLYEQSLSQQLMMEQEKLNRELYTRVTTYLKKYGTDKGLHVVLKRDPTSDVMWAVDALDVSQDVISGLNDEYKTEKSGVKADSTAVKK